MAHNRIVKPHWKQRFHVDGPFVFLRSVMLEEGRVQVGDPVPDYLAEDKHRMKMWFNGDIVGMAHWDYENGCPKAPAYESLGGAWFLFPDGEKVHGKKALEAKLATLV